MRTGLAAEHEEMTATLQRMERGIAEANERLAGLEARLNGLESAFASKRTTA
jgi:hypothetical protein